MRYEYVVAGKHDFSDLAYDEQELRAKDDESIKQMFDGLNAALSDAVTRLNHLHVEFHQASEIASYRLKCVELIEAEMFRRRLIKPDQQK